jgi:hypothetical protein
VHCRRRAIGDLSLGSRYAISSSAFERLARRLQRSTSMPTLPWLNIADKLHRSIRLPH